MKVYEFGKDNKNTFLMFQCAVEPWWVFKKSAEAVAKDFRVFLFISDGHDESGTDFVSIERNVKQAVSYLKEKNIFHLDIAYGISMGGSSVMYMLAHQLIPVKKATIDAGITPYPYPKWLCRIIAIRDYLMVKAAFRSIQLMKIAMPPQRWTPKGEDPQEHYLKLFEFGNIIPTRQFTMFFGRPIIILCPNPFRQRKRKWNTGTEKKKRRQEEEILLMRKRRFR